jgi:hypothetical protein
LRGDDSKGNIVNGEMTLGVDLKPALQRSHDGRVLTKMGGRPNHFSSEVSQTVSSRRLQS